MLICLVLVTPTAAVAMGSGDAFQDAQTGLSYTVNKPADVLGLKLSNFQVIICADKREQWVYATYSKGLKYIEIIQTQAGMKCSNPGLSKKLPSVKINGHTAKVYVYCDPTNSEIFKSCSDKDISRVGGYLIFSTKATKKLKGTEIQVQGVGGITYAQLIKVAQSLKKVN